MKPFLKWPGSKRRICPFLTKKVSPFLSVNGRYIELFAGSASLLFALEPKRAVLVDTCKPLMAFYEAIRREPYAVHSELQVLIDLPFSEETFVQIKEEWNGFDFGVKFAARLLYLSKLGFNGLFRLNGMMKYNVGWGKKKKLPSFPSIEEFVEASNLLRRTTLYSKNYGHILRAAHAGDVVYADPPYWGTYDRYAGASFREADQRKLADALRRASDRGVTVFASNVDCEEVRKLYEPWAELETVHVLHKIGCTSDSRKKVSELFISATSPVINRQQLDLFDLNREAMGA